MSNSVLKTIESKRDGRELTQDDIQSLIRAYADDSLPDYQMAAFAMAVFLNGMTPEETAALTDAMLHSGDVLKWDIDAPIVDKHSTGGIGDKVSILLAPMLAACGVKVPMISGRGLGPTGGTLDKLESIPGFRTNLNVDELQAIVRDVGCVITGASDRIAPADRKLYALRDVTATVPSIPLITASIMCKKLSEGLDALVLDVKVGSGAFMKTLDDARALAQAMREAGRRLNVKTSAVMTDMNQPLGRMIGNAVEIDESIEALKGNGPNDLMEVTLRLGAELLIASGVSPALDSATSLLQETVDSGSAMEKLEQMVEAQGGKLSERRPRGESVDLCCEKAGFVQSIANEQLGWTVIELGGGRKTLTDAIDHSVGLEMLVRVGDPVDSKQPWLQMFGSSDSRRNEAALKLLTGSITISETPVPTLPVITE